MSYRKLLLVAAVIIFVSVPLGVQAYQIAPNPNYGTIQIKSNDVASNDENFINEGGVRNNGTINNYSTLTNSIMNSFLYNFGTIYNSGTLTNQSTMSYIYNGGNLSNTGNIVNNGVIDNESSKITNHGILYNYGTLTNTIQGSFLSNVGSMYNYGNLINKSTVSGIFNSGYLSNTGKITNNGALHNELSGNLSNSGSLFNYESLSNYGTLSNSGSLYNYYTSNKMYNYGNLSNSGNLYNDGTLINNSSLLNTGTFINEGGGGMSITGGGIYTQTAGQTILNLGGLNQTSIDIQGGSLSGSMADITGNVLIASGASIHPGNPAMSGNPPSVSLLTITGNFSSSGTLLIGIAGLDIDQYNKYSLLYIAGEANFLSGANIEFDFINGYKPSKGDSWDFLFAHTITGWDKLKFTLVGLDSGFEWDTELFTGGARLLITDVHAPVPIPGAVFLLGTGLGLLVLYNRRKLTDKN